MQTSAKWSSEINNQLSFQRCLDSPKAGHLSSNAESTHLCGGPWQSAANCSAMLSMPDCCSMHLLIKIGDSVDADTATRKDLKSKLPQFTCCTRVTCCSHRLLLQLHRCSHRDCRLALTAILIHWGLPVQHAGQELHLPWGKSYSAPSPAQDSIRHCCHQALLPSGTTAITQLSLV